MANDSQTSRHFAIIPAAGRSRRMGQAKLLLPVAGRPLIEVVLDAWRGGGVDEIVAVCRADDSPLIDLCQRAGAIVVTPAEPPPEMKDSVAAALREIATRFRPASHDTWLLAPADLPRLSSAVIGRLLAAHDPRQPQILVPFHGGRRGHPILLPWELSQDVYSLGAEQGVNQLLQQHAIREIDCGAEALPADLDTPEDYRRLR